MSSGSTGSVHTSSVGDVCSRCASGAADTPKRKDSARASGAWRSSASRSRSSTAARAPIVHVYPEGGEIGRVFRPALGIVSDLNAFAIAAAAAGIPLIRPLQNHRMRWRRRHFHCHVIFTTTTNTNRIRTTQ